MSADTAGLVDALFTTACPHQVLDSFDAHNGGAGGTQVPQASCRRCLTSFAAQQRAGVWSQAAQELLRHNAHAIVKKCCWRMPTKTANCLAQAFERRAQEEAGR